MRWHHISTADGWDIRDENGLLVATIHNPAHDREDDARLLADAPRLHERLNLYEPDVATRKARLVQEQIAWTSSGWFSLGRAQRFHRGLRLLAKHLGRDAESVSQEIRAEAQAIVEKEG